MIPCVTCPTGTYQLEYGGTQCDTCPDGTWTTIAGADTIDKCMGKDIIEMNLTFVNLIDV